MKKQSAIRTLLSVGQQDLVMLLGVSRGPNEIVAARGFLSMRQAKTKNLFHQSLRMKLG